jgi:hypothetical protein
MQASSQTIMVTLRGGEWASNEGQCILQHIKESLGELAARSLNPYRLPSKPTKELEILLPISSDCSHSRLLIWLNIEILESQKKGGIRSKMRSLTCLDKRESLENWAPREKPSSLSNSPSRRFLEKSTIPRFESGAQASPKVS